MEPTSTFQGQSIVLKTIIILTPKIPSVFLPISAVYDLLGGIHFSTKKSMRT
jgi:hypothetical protein